MGTRADTFLGGMEKEISEKRVFFVHRSVSENFQWEIFSGQVPTESLGTQDSGKKFKKKLPCFGHPKSGECDQMWSVSKNMSRCKEEISHNF